MAHFPTTRIFFSFFILFSICITFLTSIHPAMATVTSEYAALGDSFRTLRTQKGHWDGEDSNPATDNFNGEKHQVMKRLGEYFGKPGTAASDILSTMGQPDEIRQSLGEDASHVSMMPGPALRYSDAQHAVGAGHGDFDATVMPSNVPEQTMYFIYKWRGNHDYLWFKIDAVKECVIESEWYQAYE